MELNTRIISILEHLIEESQLSINYLIKKFTVSSRTIRYDIEKINQILEENNLDKIVKKGEIFYLEKTKSIQLYKDLLLFHSHLSIEDRCDYILLYLLMNRKIILESLVKELNVTRRTLNNDLKKIKIKLSKLNIKIENLKEQGLSLTGPERIIRAFFIKLFVKFYIGKNTLPLAQKKFIDSFIEKIDIEPIDHFCSDLNKNFFYVSNYVYSAIIVILTMAKLRNKKYSVPEKEMENIKKIKESKTFALISDLLPLELKKHLDSFDIIMLVTTITNSSYTPFTYEEFSKNIFINFIKDIKSQLNISFHISAEFIDKAYELIKIGVYKTEMNIIEKNFSINRFPITRTSLYNLIKDIIHRYFPNFHEEDIISLTILFKNFIDIKMPSFYKKNLIIIDTSNDNWIGNIVKNNLNLLFHVEKIEIVPIYELKNFFNEHKNVNFDLIVSLDDFDINIDTEIPILKVNFFEIYSNPYCLEGLKLLRKF